MKMAWGIQQIRLAIFRELYQDVSSILLFNVWSLTRIVINMGASVQTLQDNGKVSLKSF